MPSTVPSTAPMPVVAVDEDLSDAITSLEEAPEAPEPVEDADDSSLAPEFVLDVPASSLDFLPEEGPPEAPEPVQDTAAAPQAPEPIVELEDTAPVTAVESALDSVLSTTTDVQQASEEAGVIENSDAYE